METWVLCGGPMNGKVIKVKPNQVRVIARNSETGHRAQYRVRRIFNGKAFADFEGFVLNGADRAS